MAALAADPQPLQNYVDTTYVPPTGNTLTVNTGGDLQGAINAAVPGDVIVVQAGATFTGNFTLPAKTGSGWVTIRTSTPDSSLPIGTRVTPTQAPLMPKIVTAQSVAVLATSGVAAYYRIIGIEMTMSNTTSYGLVTLGTGSETAASQLPHHIIIDRCYIHGATAADVQNGIRLNSAWSAIIESYIDQCQAHAAVFESHDIGCYNGSGPFKINNNFLGGAFINVLFGGAVPSITGQVPSDIEFRYNHCYRPPSWYTDPTYGVKNLFELKYAQRVLIEGNIMEYNWEDPNTTLSGGQQSGWAMLLTVRDQTGAVPWAVVQDVMVTKNIIRHSNAGVQLYGAEGTGTHRIKFENNLFDDIGSNWGNNTRTGMGMQVQQVSDLTVDHNTFYNNGPNDDIIFATYTGTAIVNEGGLVYTNNIQNFGNYGVNGVGTNTGFPTFTAYFGLTPAYVYQHNAMMCATDHTSAYPSLNWCPATWSAVGFTDITTSDYRLVSTSPYKGQATDGTDVGCMQDAINTATNGNVAPVISAATATPNPAIVSQSVSFSATASDANGDALTYSWTFGDGGTASTSSATHSYSAAGTYTATVTVSDGSLAVSKTVSVTVNTANAPSITTASLPVGDVGTAYKQTTLAATGGTAPYTWSISAGTLPAGLSLSTAGVISGTPTTAGTASFTVKCTDSVSASSTKALSITINAAPSITTTSLAADDVNVAYSTTFAVSGGTSPFTWSVSAGTLPAGLTLSAAGVLSGTPTAAGTASFTIKVTDAVGAAPTKAFSLTINAAPSITTASLPAGMVGVAYSQTLAETGGTTPFTWSVSSGTLPAGLTLSAAGVLSGTPTTAGTSSFTIKVTDAVGAASTKAFSLTINAALSITTASLPSGTVGVAYSQTLAGTGGTTPYTWSISAGTLPAGLTLSAAGVLSGTPTAAGTSSFTIKVTDAVGTASTKAFSLTITAALSITTASLPSGMVGVAYSQTLAGTGGTTPYTWSISAGTLPAGLSLSAGKISGTPTTAGTSSFTVKLTDAAGGSATHAYSVTINPNSAPTITSAALANPNPAAVGQSVTFTVAASDADGDTLTYSWAFGDGATGSGSSATHAYTAAGSFTATATVSDGHGNSVTSSVTVSVVANAAPVITSSTTASSTNGSSFSYTITATNTPTSYNATPIPPGLSVAAGTGVLSGTPTSAGTFSITISATNSGGTGSATLTLTVATGPVGYWKLDDGSGASAADSSGFGNTGTLVNGPAWTTGQVNGALSFNGSSQYVTVPAPTGSSLDLDKAPVTIAAWVNTNTITAQQAILVRGLSNGIGSGNQGYGLWITSGGKINVGSAGGGNFSSNVAITASAWHQITAIINGTASKVYIDGVDQTPASVNIGVVTSSLPLTIGASRNNTQTGYVGFFNGTLDDVRVYNRALSASEAATLAGMSTAAPALALDVAAAPVADSAALTAADAGTLSVTKMSASVAFGTSHSACSISGTISGLSGFSPAGQTFTINVMGASGSFTLNAKGQGKSSQGSVALKGGKFQAKLTGGLAAAWSLVPSSTKTSWQMDMWVSVDLAGTEYSAPFSVTCSSSAKGAKLKK
jgi:hypothetical protein